MKNKCTIPETGYRRPSQNVSSFNNPPLIHVLESTWWTDVKLGGFRNTSTSGHELRCGEGDLVYAYIRTLLEEAP